jgi:YidC/Oxa1 family membrane protein insertase
MMEDKKTLLAFLFIGLILLAMPYYYELVGLDSQSESVEEIQPPEEVSQSSPTIPSLSESPASSDTPVAIESPIVGETPDSFSSDQSISASIPRVNTEHFTPRDISVKTPFQELAFSTKGGTLTSVRLLRYDNQVEKDKVELIPPGGRGLVLSLNQHQELLDLSGVEFLPDQEGLTVHPGEEGTLRLTAELDGGIRIAKVFRFSGDSYGILFDLEYEGLAEGGQAILSWEYGIARTEKKPPGGFFGMSGAQIVRTVAFMNEERIQVEPEEEHKDKGLLRWAGIVNSYFFLAIAPTEEGYYNVELFGQDSSQDMFSWNEASFTIGTRVEGAGKFSTMIYAGPLDYEHLATYERDLEQGIDLGWPVIRDISKVLLTIFVTVHQYIPNYGWVLVIFAFCIKILVYPLTHKSYSSMAKMQEVQPKITGLREKYKNDQQRLTQETMKLYKEEGVNPLGGCLPIVLQMPVFFALYKLFYSIELRHEPFILWINDLSVPDEILIAGFGLHVLPLIFAISQVFQSRMTMRDPKQAFMVYLMPVMMIFIFWSLPSGLVLYWTVFNALTIGQQYLVNYLKKGAPVPQLVPTAPIKKRKA